MEVTNNNNNNIPVMTGATGMVTKDLRGNLEAIPGKHWRDHHKRQLRLQHHIIRKVLQSETEAWPVGITAGSVVVPGRKGM